jgi:hypothetical protein
LGSITPAKATNEEAIMGMNNRTTIKSNLEFNDSMSVSTTPTKDQG